MSERFIWRSFDDGDMRNGEVLIKVTYEVIDSCNV